MTTPNGPSQYPLTTTNPPPISSQTTGASPAPFPGVTKETSTTPHLISGINTQAWASWLGPNATSQDVQRFFNNLLNFFSKTIMTQINAAHERENRQAKNLAEGKDYDE
ncbi:MAG: hypothetical protein K2P51_06025 [Rhabdochlamydiaceae bacterium]|nr:hypothetical protein [Rhabdochlamydiaceae bacterium]